MALGRESSLEAAGALSAAAPSLGSILGSVVGHRDPPVRPNSNSAEFHASLVLNHNCYVVLGLNWP